MTFRNGLASLLRPQDSVLLMIDHQPFQLAALNSHDKHMVVNNSAGLTKAAKAFGSSQVLMKVRLITFWSGKTSVSPLII